LLLRPRASRFHSGERRIDGEPPLLQQIGVLFRPQEKTNEQEKNGHGVDRPMHRQVLPCILLFTALTLAANTASADPFRILYAEQIDLPLDRGVAGAASKPRLAPQFALSAYGRQLDLRVEQNTSLIRSLTPDLLNGKAVYRGDVAGIERSWVRLTVLDGEVYGAIWDGADLYSIAPGHEVERYMDAPLPDSSSEATFVYRLSDTQGGIDANFCGAASDGAERGAALRQFRSVLNELKSSLTFQATGDGPLQIEVALIADYEFHGRFGDPQGEMLVRANIVDGIFDAQLGVAIIPTDLIVFNDSANPFSSTAAPTLLNQLSSYRNSTPVVRERGLAHLLTGKDLDGSTAGIAFIDALCDPQRGAGVSEGALGSSVAALIIAHELGHNFGAPHDGQAGSACAGAPSGFLMSPEINYSSTFSSCSVAQMQPRITAAQCIGPLKITDAAVEVSPSIQAYAHETFELPVDVRSVGQLTAQNVSVLASFANISVESAELSGGVCSAPGGVSVTCQIESLAPGEVRRMTVRARSTFMGVTHAQVQVSAQNDRNAENNSANVRIDVGTASDISITSSPANISGLVRSPISFSIDLDSLGARAARNVRADLYLEALEIISASTTGGSCNPSQNVMTCTFDEIAPGVSRRIDLTVQAQTVSGQWGSIEVTADNDVNIANNHHSFQVSVTPLKDVRVEVPVVHPTSAVGEPFDVSIALQSLGVGQSNPATLTITAPIEGTLIIDSATVEGGACTIDAQTVLCSVGSIEPGGSRSIALRARGVARGEIPINVSVSSPADDNAGNNTGFVRALVLPAVDVGLSWVAGPTYYAYVGAPPVRARAMVRSSGAYAATDVTVRMTIPTQFAIRGAAFEGGSCSTAAQVVTCTRTTLARDAAAELQVDVEAMVAGDFMAPVEVSAVGDAESSNNTLQLSLVSRVGSDVRIEPSAPVAALVGVQQTIPINVANANVDVGYVRVNLSAPQHVVFDSLRMDGGSCWVSGTHGGYCELWGGLSANTARVIELRLRAILMLDFNVTIQASSNDLDINPANNAASIPVAVSDRQGDASVQVSRSNVTAEVGQSFAYPSITVSAATAVDDARLSVAFDPTLVAIVSAGIEGGVCSFNGGGIDCLLGTIESGAARTMNLTLQANRAGAFTSAVTLSSRNDMNGANNAGQVSVSLTNPPPPPTPQQPAQSSSGGGAMAAREALAFLALVLLARLRRRARSVADRL
jgi:hypothetical protein